jgi:hypothetical protein
LFALAEGTRSGKPAGTWSGRSLSSQSHGRSRVGANGAARRDGSERAGRSEGGAYTETLAFVMDKWVDAQTGYYRHTGKAHAHRRIATGASWKVRCLAGLSWQPRC